MNELYFTRVMEKKKKIPTYSKHMKYQKRERERGGRERKRERGGRWGREGKGGYLFQMAVSAVTVTTAIRTWWSPEPAFCAHHVSSVYRRRCRRTRLFPPGNCTQHTVT